MSSQKGDWVACESTLRMLEKEAQEGGPTKPLNGVADNVSLARILFVDIQKAILE